MTNIIRVDKQGWDECEHAWEDATYNDWGFPYFVARCKFCKRAISSPTVNVFALLMADAPMEITVP